MARLFAKALNCQSKTKEGDACGTCELCQEISSGAAIDIVEIDAASNRGIDEMREIRERINFSPTRLPYKVYIIDEVHMLTKEAFNALLKTLEEPPSHAVFILATTELHKVPETVMSRCQRYHFHRASATSLRRVIGEVAEKEKISLSEEAIQLLAERADGSYRDALTLLGSLAAQSKKLTPEVVRELLGLPTEEVITALHGHITTGDVVGVTRFLQSNLEVGTDLTILVRQWAELLKKKMFSTDNQSELEAGATLLEQALLLLARTKSATDSAGLIAARLIALAAERQPATIPVIRELPPVTPPPASSVTDIRKKEEMPNTSEPVQAAVDAVTSPVASVDNNDFWSAFLQEIKQHNHALYMLIRSARLLDVTAEKLILAVKFKFYSERLFETKNRKLVEQAAQRVSGRILVLECQVRTDLDEPKRKNEAVIDTVVDVFELEEVAS